MQTTTAPINLPPGLPAVSSAKLPKSYERAKVALAECYEVDECKSWADKAMALASYARQAKDESLYKTAARIQGRALRRVGELQKQFQTSEKGGRPVVSKKNGGNKNGGGAPTVSQRQVAQAAGLSKDQEITASRIANIPEEEFEELIESENPPTVTELAERGKKAKPKPLVDLKGRDPEVFQIATRGQGAINFLVRESKEVPPKTFAAGLLPKERSGLLRQIDSAIIWLTDVGGRIQKDIDNGKD